MCRSRASLRRADRLRSVSLSAGWLCWRAAVVMASLHLHHTPTVAVQPAYSVAKLASADCLTAYRRKRTILSPRLGFWSLSWLNNMMMSP